MGILGRLLRKSAEDEFQKEINSQLSDYTPQPDFTDTPQVRADNSSFRLVVDDNFTIPGRGTVVTGTVESGQVSIKDTVTLVRCDGSKSEVSINGIEMFRKLCNTAKVGGNAGILLKGIGRNDISKGDILEKKFRRIIL